MPTKCFQSSSFKHHQPAFPEEFNFSKSGIEIFLAGSINMGNATEWQKEMITALGDMNVTVNNPRLDTFDKHLEQDINNPRFKYQVDWEMHHLDKSDIIAIYFEPDLNPARNSPITLLELGLHAKEHANKSQLIVVCCPKGYQRRGNVQIVCQKYGIPLVDTKTEFEAKIRANVRDLQEASAVRGRD